MTTDTINFDLWCCWHHPMHHCHLNYPAPSSPHLLSLWWYYHSKITAALKEGTPCTDILPRCTSYPWWHQPPSPWKYPQWWPQHNPRTDKKFSPKQMGSLTGQLKNSLLQCNHTQRWYHHFQAPLRFTYQCRLGLMVDIGYTLWNNIQPLILVQYSHTDTEINKPWPIYK